MADTKQMLELGYTIMLVVMPKASREAAFKDLHSKTPFRTLSRPRRIWSEVTKKEEDQVAKSDLEAHFSK